MKSIGITGGVGCGKSTVLELIRQLCPTKCRILLADDIANELKLYGQPLYQAIIDLLGYDIVDESQDPPQIDKKKMADIIFNPKNHHLLKAVNDLVHPAVRNYILYELDRCRKSQEYGYFFLEAALLLEEKYDEILDEIWYIYSGVSTRRERLKSSRGYSDEKIDSIISKQMSEADFRRRCNCVIDNDGSLENTRLSVLKALEMS